MAQNLAEGILSDVVGDISILIIDHDTASVASLKSMLEKFSTKVMSINEASKAKSMIEEHKDFGLIMVNTEMRHIDSDSFLNTLLHNDIPLILMHSVIKNHKTSDLLTSKARFFLNKPISENDIKDMWEYVLPKKVMDEQKNQIEAFRKSLKRQRASTQASLLGRRRRPCINRFTSPEAYQNRSNVANVEWRNNQNIPIEIESKREENKLMENNSGRPCSLWTHERHMKFLAALSILGEENQRPISIMRILNDPELTYSQVASHLQKYKARVERISDKSPRNECKSTDKTFNYPSNYEYPSKASNLRKNLIDINSLRKKSSSSSSISQFSLKKPDTFRETEMPTFLLGGKLDLSNYSHFGDVSNKSSMDNHVSSSKNPSYTIPSTHYTNHFGLVSTGLGNENLPVHSGLVSSVGPSNTNTIQTESTRISIPQSDPNQFQPPSSSTEIDWSKVDIDDLLDILAPDLCNKKESNNVLPENINSLENYSHLEGNMNHIDWNPSIDNPEASMNIVVPQTNIDPIGWVPSQGYVPPENMMGSHFNIGQIGNVSSEIPLQPNIPETNNQYNPVEGYDFPQNVTPFEANTSQMGFVPCDTSYAASNNMVPLNTNMEEKNYAALDNMVPLQTNMQERNYAALDNMVPLGTNMEETNNVAYKEDDQVPIEDLISFDIDPNDKPWWLEDNESSGTNSPLSTRSTSQQA